MANKPSPIPADVHVQTSVTREVADWVESWRQSTGLTEPEAYRILIELSRRRLDGRRFPLGAPPIPKHMLEPAE